MEIKKTEAELRHDIRREHSLSENNPKEKAVIDKMLKLKKDKFQLLGKNKELKESKSTTEPKGDEKQEPIGDLTVKDAALLQENKVPTADWDIVTDYAKFKKISIEEALKSTVVKASLKESQEERIASNAVQTGKNRSGSSKIDGHKVLDSIKKNPSKEISDEEIDAAVDARWSEKHSK